MNRCLQLAAAATKLEPTNVEWWRLRALLGDRESLYSSDPGHRDADWLTTLDECARHDPDNALYDYLAACSYWDAALKVDYPNDPRAKPRLVVKNRGKFQKGIDRFEQGQAKRYVVVGDSGFTAVADFLSHTRLQFAEHPDIINSRAIHLRRSGLLTGVCRWQRLRVDDKASAGDLETVLALGRQNLHLIAQFERGGPSNAYDSVTVALKTAIAWQMRAIAETHKDTLGDAEAKKTVSLNERAVLQQKIVECAGQDLQQRKKQATASTGTVASAASAFVVGVAPSLAILILVVGLVATIASRRASQESDSAVGVAGQVLTLLVAAAITVALLGLAPAEIIGTDVQSWLFTIGLLSMPVGLVLWIGWCWLRRRAFQFSIRSMLVFTAVVSLFFSLVAVVGPESFLRGLPFPSSVPARGWQGLDPSVFGNAVRTKYGVWYWAAFQWSAYGGPYWTVALWGGLLLALHDRRVRKVRRQTGAPLPKVRKRLCSLLGSLRWPALTASAVVLTAYLLLTADVLGYVEREFQRQMVFPRHPQTYWANVEQAVQRIRDDAETMKDLREYAKAEASKPTDSDSQE